MKILVVGSDRDFKEFEQKFGEQSELSHTYDYSFTSDPVKTELVFDFFVGDEPELFANYQGMEQITLFVNSPKISLAELSFFNEETNNVNLFGFNGLPGFVDREVLEVSALFNHQYDQIKEICRSLQTDFQLVEDRVGMVTARIICMIINEAFYTVQEGTANRADIDLGMKLGTNYPKGPFEWCDSIGIQNVYELLESLYEDTKDERYKTCPLLKREYLMA